MRKYLVPLFLTFLMSLTACGPSVVYVGQGTAGKDGRDGKDGADGTDGQDASINPLDIKAILNPCGDAPNIYDEVFIQLNNGTVFVSMSDKVNGENTRFVVLPAGTYMTTDGDKCIFTIDAAGNIINESKHY